MRILSALFLALVCNIAYATCTPHFDGIQQSNVPEISSYIPCEYCRSVQDFPDDFLNAASNFVFHTDRGLSALGRYSGRLSNGALTFPVCSEDHGQCATATVTLNFNYVEVPFYGEVVSMPMGIENYVIGITDGGGNRKDRTSASADAPPVYLIPDDIQPDTIPDGECRDNTGGATSGNSDTGSGGGPGGGGGGADGPIGGGNTGGGHTGGGDGGGGERPRCTSTDDGREIVVTCSAP